MLLYRPLLAGYQHTEQPGARRFILRELANPDLHAEPDELLKVLQENPVVTMVGDPARLFAEVALRERVVRLRLTRRDRSRSEGGMWTVIAGGREMSAWARSVTSVPTLARAAGELLGQPAVKVLRSLEGEPRALLLTALGDLGNKVALGTLREELTTGRMPVAAAMGLARLGGEAESCFLPALQARGLAQSAGWLGVALARLPTANNVALLRRLANAREPEEREHAAWALGSFAEHDVGDLIELFKGETDLFVKLNVVASLGRLGVPGGLKVLGGFYKTADPEIMRTAVIRAAGRSDDAGMEAFLERVGRSGSPEEQAEALQALVFLRVSGERHLEAARRAASGSQARLLLVGMLALARWAPEEAFARVRKVFSGPPSSLWYIATYVLRYLRTDQTVPLLSRVCSAVKGTDLEEISVSALCRHLDEPDALPELLSIAQETTSPKVMHRMMQDIARHLPAERAPEALEALKKLLAGNPPAQLAGPMIVAIGSLGGADEVAALASYARNPETAEAAIHGLELLTLPAATEVLGELVQGPVNPATSQALVALFRLGDRTVTGHLERLAGEDDAALVARSLVDMCLSVRAAKGSPCLARLYALLEKIAETLPEYDADAELLSQAPQAQAPAKRQINPQAAFSSARRTAVQAQALPNLTKGVGPAPADVLYKDMASHLRGKAVEPPATTPLWKGVLAGVLALSLLGGGAALLMRRPPRPTGEAAVASRLPPLFRAGVDPDDGQVKPGTALDGSAASPVVVHTRFRENTLTIKGKLTVTSIDFTTDEQPRARFKGALTAGYLDVAFPRGTAQIVVEGARTTVEVVDGAASFELKESTFRLAVTAGKARIMRGVIPMRTLVAGQGGEFLDGNPAGRIEEVSVPSASPAASVATATPSPGPR